MNVLKTTVVLLTVVGFCSSLKIASWNIWQMSQEVTSDPDRLNIITKVFSSHDLVIVQGARECKPLGQITRTLPGTWKVYCSPDYVTPRTPAPRSESFGFVWNTEKVQIDYQDIYRYADVGDKFDVDLPVARVRTSDGTNIKEFLVVNVHIFWQQALKELAQIPDVYQQLSTQFSTTDILFAGDFNAGPPFLNRTDYDNLELTTNTGLYQWLISFEQDATASPDFNGAWARILIASPAGGALRQSYVPNSGKVVNLITDEAFGPLTSSQAEAISPLMPVEIELR